MKFQMTKLLSLSFARVSAHDLILALATSGRNRTNETYCSKAKTISLLPPNRPIVPVCSSLARFLRIIRNLRRYGIVIRANQDRRKVSSSTMKDYRHHLALISSSLFQARLPPLVKSCFNHQNIKQTSSSRISHSSKSQCKRAKQRTTRTLCSRAWAATSMNRLRSRKLLETSSRIS